MANLAYLENRPLVRSGFSYSPFLRMRWGVYIGAFYTIPHINFRLLSHKVTIKTVSLNSSVSHLNLTVEVKGH